MIAGKRQFLAGEIGETKVRDTTRLNFYAPAIAFIACTVAGSACAADIRVKAPARALPAAVHDWSGFYAGIHGGYGWGDADHSFLPVPGINSPFQPNIPAAPLTSPSRAALPAATWVTADDTAPR